MLQRSVSRILRLSGGLCSNLPGQLRHSSSNMRLVQFLDAEKRRRVGIQLEKDGNVVDLNAANDGVPTNLRSFLEGGDAMMGIARKILESGKHVLDKNSIKLLAPITNPEKLFCIGMNYVDHCAEQNVPVPEEPVVFNKFQNAIVGPTDDIIYPDVTKELDWEVEMTIVIGKAGKNIKVEDAGNHIAGYTVAHDVSARDWQLKRNGNQWLIGKAMDTFCPLGPALVTKDSISDPHNLGIRCRVNGKTVQDSNTSQMVFKSEQLVAHLSQFMTLQAGDLILTGTPPGVGVFRKPPVFLKKGDVVECEIDEIGTITNKVV